MTALQPWTGAVAVAASGPSFTAKQAWQLGKLRAQDKIRVIAVSDAVYPCWFADVLYAADYGWWKLQNGLPDFHGLKLSVEERLESNNDLIPAPYASIGLLRYTGVTGWDDAPDALRGGGNSGNQAVQLAAKIWTPNLIVLVGFDFSEKGARDHFFGLHEGSMDRHSNVQEWRNCFRETCKELGRRGIAVMNASGETTIDFVHRTDLSRIQWPAQ